MSAGGGLGAWEVGVYELASFSFNLDFVQFDTRDYRLSIRLSFQSRLNLRQLAAEHTF